MFAPDCLKENTYLGRYFVACVWPITHRCRSPALPPRKAMEEMMSNPEAAEQHEKAAALAATLAPRKRNRRKKRPEALVLRVVEPEVLRGDYDLR